MIFTLPTKVPRYTQAPMLYLKKYFLDNTLLLLDQDTEVDERLVSRAVTDTSRYSQWDQQFEHIKQFVIDNHICAIVIHAAINPVELDQHPNFYTPTFLEMQQQLSTVATTYILTGDFYYYYNTTPNIIFFPVFLWLNNSKRTWEFFNQYAKTVPIIISTERSNTVYDIDFEPKTKTVMCLNSTAVWHRIYLFSLLASKSWLGTIGYSFRPRAIDQDNFNLQDRLKAVAVTQFMSAKERAIAESYAHLIPIQIPEDNKFDLNKSSIDNWIYRSYAINLVTETSLTEGVMLTEKICKPFMSYQIPILIASPGASQFLEDVGLDMFSDYIPWKTWDQEEDHKLRIRRIVEFVDKLLSSPTAEQDILLSHQQFQSRIIKNKEYFHSTEFTDILLKQISTL